MNLKSLSNEQLEKSLKSLVRQERQLLSEILHHIAEVERRKFYMKSYPNLYKYLESELGYTGGTAQRYKDAALLLMDIPDLAEKMESNEISMAQVELVQRSCRAKSGKTSKETKQKLINDLRGKSLSESQQTVAQALDIEIKASPKITTQKDGSVRMEVTFTKEQWEKMQTMREVVSTSLPCGHWDQILEYVADKVINQKTPKNPPKESENLTESKKKFVLQKDQCCQYENAATKTKCGSRWNLQVDHIKPIWAGGTNEIENLRAMCANHNRYRYKEQSGLYQ